MPTICIAQTSIQKNARKTVGIQMNLNHHCSNEIKFDGMKGMLMTSQKHLLTFTV